MSSRREVEIRRIFDCLRKGTDKSQHNYAPVYASLPDDLTSVLEIGVDKGFSLLAWTEVFPHAAIHGIDTDPKVTDPGILAHPRIRVERADVRTYDLAAPVDLIIDDCLHDLDTISVAWYRFRDKFRVAYVIEDVRPEIMTQVYELLTSTDPHAQVIFWRTSEYKGDVTFRQSDSHCFIVRAGRI